MTEEHRMKISKALKGKTKSKSHIENISKNHADFSGKNNPNYGNGDKIKGNKNPFWKGGKYKSSDGYVYIYSPNHPNTTSGCYVKRSRLKMEKKLGRYLKRSEIVHHKNELKDDDRLCNLELKTNIEHGKHHYKTTQKIDNKTGRFIKNG